MERMALNRAFSAPRSWPVLAGYLARLRREPALAINLAASYSPMRYEVLGAMACMRFLRYSPRDSLYS